MEREGLMDLVKRIDEGAPSPIGPNVPTAPTPEEWARISKAFNHLVEYVKKKTPKNNILDKIDREV